MTLEDLIIEVDRFGSGDTIGNRATMISTINRALTELYLNIPITKTIRFNVRGHKPVTYYKEIICKTGQSIVIPMHGKAYSMRVMGRGNYTVNDGGTMNAFQFDTGNETRVMRGFIGKGGSIRLWGSFTFVVYDLSIYDEVYSNEVESIPEGSPITVYNIKELYTDFLSFVSPVTDRFGNIIDNCKLYDGLLEIDSSYSGQIILVYRRLPTLICGEEESLDSMVTVDISDDYVNLLVYLIWYHYWYNIDEAKAKIYRERFDAMVKLVSESISNIDRKYINENGWA